MEFDHFCTFDPQLEPQFLVASYFLVYCSKGFAKMVDLACLTCAQFGQSAVQNGFDALQVYRILCDLQSLKKYCLRVRLRDQPALQKIQGEKS